MERRFELDLDGDMDGGGVPSSNATEVEFAEAGKDEAAVSESVTQGLVIDIADETLNIYTRR